MSPQVRRTFLITLAWLFVAAAISPLGGCAFGNRHVDLIYTPLAKPAATGTGTVVVVAFADARTEKELVGDVRNGFGSKTAKVLLTKGQDVSNWVTEAVVAELGAAGLVVERKEPSAVLDTDIVVSGALTELYTTLYMTYDPNVRVSVTMKRGGQVVLDKTYQGKHVEPAVFGAAQEYERAYTGTLRDILKQAVPDIVNGVTSLNTAPASP